jgi:hypothetical protein
VSHQPNNEAVNKTIPSIPDVHPSRRPPERKVASVLWIGSSIGSIIAAPIPMLWGTDLYSYSVAISSCIGSLIGWWVEHKMSSTTNKPLSCDNE